MKSLKEIGSFFTSVKGIIVALISVVTILSSVLLRHDANVIRKYNEKTIQTSDHTFITYLMHADTVRRNEDAIKWQGLYDRLGGISDSLNTNYSKTANLTNNYVEFARKNSATVDDFVNAVSGLEVVMVRSDNKSMGNPEFKMIIQKKK